MLTKFQQDVVFELIKSMTKSEKRSFRLYATRLEDSKDAKFLALFDVMDKADEYNEDKFLAKSGVSKLQYANVKNYLFQQLLISLRQNLVEDYEDISLHEQIDFARILYSKGMYKQSLKLLNKAKLQAQQKTQNTIALEIVEFEKLIESQFITHSSTTRADELTNEAEKLSHDIQKANEFSNFSIQLYALYLKRGHVRNQNDIHFMEDYYQVHRPKIVVGRVQGLYEQLYMNLSNYWYSYINQDFLQCYRHSQRNMTLFDEHPTLRNHLPVLYFKTYNYLLESFFFLRHYNRYKETLAELEQALSHLAEQRNTNAEIFANAYYLTGKINLHFFEGSFTEGLPVVPHLLSFLEAYESKIDPHYIMVFYYKIACLYFGSGDYKKCISFLNKIIDVRDEDIRSDLQCFARILRLIATYEAGDTEMMEYQIQSTHRFLIKMNDLNIIQKEVLIFLGKIDTFFRQDIVEKFETLYYKILPYESHPYEKRPFLYLDIISWLESKIQKVDIQQIIQKKFQKIAQRQ
ncbi:hypothetical protein FACS189452_07630 [Bacteroidia bacterium]|nr:hypothetical protein FACS189452_07630 [Bacteroidia bacterium]